MTICFLVDTSSSMGTCYKNNIMKSSKDKCYANAMDCTRIALEEGLKIIARHNPMRSLSLLQTENNIKCLTCGFGSPITIVEEKVKVLVHNEDDKLSHDDIDHTIYTYPLSLICNISNQYRIRNDTDRFYFGRSPFISEPLDIVIITDGSSLRDGININNINKNPCIGNEFSEGPFKWDHRIHLFIVTTGNDESNLSISIPPDIVEFIRSTGGEVIRSGQGIDKTIEEFTKLINVIVASPFPATKISVNNETKHIKLKIKSIFGEWPIPEFIGKELITVRPTYPILRIDNSSDHKKFLELAKQLDISIDSYEIVSSESKLVNAFDASHIKGVTMVDNSNNFTSLPFAMILREKNKLELLIMPYNYPTLLPLIKSTLDAKNKSHLDSTGNSWIQTWRTQIDDYIRRLPGYYYNPISRLMKRIGLPFPNIEYNLNRNFIKKMKYMQTVASREIVLLEAAESKKWETLPLDAAQLAIGSAELQRGLLESPYSVTVSTSLSRSSSSVKSYDLLSSLEKMRKLIYGGPQSISMSWLSVDGIDGAGSYTQSCHAEADKNDWFGLATGANVTRQSKMTDAGRYLNVLARKEADRDPMALDISTQEEDSVKGILKRKFSVHFGNRYSQSKSKPKTSESSSSSSISMSIEGIAFDKDSYEEFLIDSPAPHRGNSSEKVKPARKMMSTSLLPIIKTESTIVVETTVSSPISVSLPPTTALSSPTSVLSSPASTSSSPVSASSLPDGWVEGFSKKHSRSFWFHAGRNESVWKRPTTND